MITFAQRCHPHLPVYRMDLGDRWIFYSPGHLVALEKEAAKDICRAWRTGSALSPDKKAHQAADRLAAHAKDVVAAWEQRRNAPLAPMCLLIYLSNRCNLSCPYCYAAGNRRQAVTGFPHRQRVIDERIVESAANSVARYCAARGLPFRLVLHGGGEPTLHWRRVQRIESLTRDIAARFGLEWSGHIATNGMLSEKKARWLADHFDSIGLACDGPPEIQNRQRPRISTRESSCFVERTASILAQAGKSFEVRTTITPETVERQTEIIYYLKERLGAKQMRFEPVYRVREQRSAEFKPDQAEWFAGHFLAAQKAAVALNCELIYSGVRLDELHGPHCSALRDVLHLTPDGAATACFFSTGSQNGPGALSAAGSIDKTTGQFVLNDEIIRRHRFNASRIPSRCQECINAYHCARECPEVCTVDNGHGPTDSRLNDSETPAPGFRCRLNQYLAEAWIKELGERLLQQDKKTIKHTGQE